MINNFKIKKENSTYSFFIEVDNINDYYILSNTINNMLNIAPPSDTPQGYLDVLLDGSNDGIRYEITEKYVEIPCPHCDEKYIMCPSEMQEYTELPCSCGKVLHVYKQV